MSPAAIAAICGVMYSPPAYWDSVPMPADARVVEIALDLMPVVCPRAVVPGHIMYACTDKATKTAFVATWKTWPGTRACLDESRRHEEAHLKGWEHP